MNPYKVELYRIDTTNSLFEKIDEIEGYKSLEFSKRLNHYGSCVMSMDVRHKKATRENLRRWVNHIGIKKNEKTVWFGPMTKFNLSIGVGVVSNLGIEAKEHMFHLNNRFTDALLNFTNEDAGDIAWGLIDHVQTKAHGELMIREGSIAATTNRDRSYEYGKVIDEIIGLSGVRGGFDFDFEYQQDVDGLIEQVNFNVLAQKGVFRQNLPKLQLGVNVNQVRAITVGEMVNTITLLGAGTGSDVPISPDEDTNIQTAFTRRETVIKEPDVSVQSTLDQKAQQFLDYNKVERYDVQVQLESLSSLSYGTFEVGDILEVDLRVDNALGEPTLIDFQGKVRILEINVEVDENGGEIVTPVISTIF